MTLTSRPGNTTWDCGESLGDHTDFEAWEPHLGMGGGSLGDGTDFEAWESHLGQLGITGGSVSRPGNTTWGCGVSPGDHTDFAAWEPHLGLGRDHTDFQALHPFGNPLM